jgi:hypothetical protein
VHLITLIIITGMPTIMVMISTMMAAKAPITTMMIMLIELQAAQVSSAMAAPAVTLSSSHLSHTHFYCMNVRYLTG